MAINKINTTAEEQSFKFLTNQSSIIRTSKCYAGCCRVRYYEFVYYYRPIADGKMTNINYVPYSYSEEDIQGFL